MLISSWVLLAVMIASASVATVLTAQFEQVFSSFGADIPALTFVFLKGRPLWWLFPAVALGAALAITKKQSYPKRVQSRFAWGLAALLVVAVITASVGFVAMYQPIFNLGKVQ